DAELVEGALELGPELEEGERRLAGLGALVLGGGEHAHAAAGPRHGPGGEAREAHHHRALEALFAERAVHAPDPLGRTAEDPLEAGGVEEEDAGALRIRLDPRREGEEAVGERGSPLGREAWDVDDGHARGLHRTPSGARHSPSKWGEAPALFLRISSSTRWRPGRVRRRRGLTRSETNAPNEAAARAGPRRTARASCSRASEARRPSQ